MAVLPTNRAITDGPADHVNDHNEIHRLHNLLDGTSGGEVVFLQGAGIDTTGVADSTAAIQTLVTNATRPVAGLSGATYKFSSITLKNGSDIRGNGASIVCTAAAGSGAFVAASKSNITVSGWTASGPLNVPLLRVVACSRVKVLNNVVTNMPVFACHSANGDLYAGSSETENNQIVISANICEATGAATPGEPAIFVLYCSDVIVEKNKMTGYTQGLQYWGGDANPNVDGAKANARKCKRLLIINNRVVSSLNGGLWGSMGDQIKILDNDVSACNDVGIDFEGSFDCLASRNTVRDCGSGNYATFSICKGIRFDRNDSIAAVAGTPTNHFVVHNSTQNASTATGNGDVTLTRNDCRTVSGIGSPLGFEACHSLIIDGNKLHNTSIFTRTLNTHNVSVTNNEMTFSVANAAAFSAIDVGYNQQTDGGIIPFTEVAGNRIRSSVQQPAGSAAISSDQTDPNSNPVLEVTRNEAYFFPIAIRSQWGAASLSGTLYSRIWQNTVDGTIVITDAGSLQPQIIQSYSNFNHVGAAFAPSRVVTGSRGGNAALASALAHLQAMGLLLNSSSV